MWIVEIIHLSVLDHFLERRNKILFFHKEKTNKLLGSSECAMSFLVFLACLRLICWTKAIVFVRFRMEDV